MISLEGNGSEKNFSKSWITGHGRYNGPMITLLLIRHGIAEDSRGSDAERALSAEGWEKSRAAMKGLVRRGYVPTRGVSSPYRRAAETMVCLQEATPEGFPVGYWDGLKPGGHPRKAETWLQAELAEMKEFDVLALVSHEPFLSSLVRHLIRQSLEVKKASCTVLHWDGQAFQFAAHFPPAELRAD